MEIWKIVDGKTIHKIDNGFVVMGLVEHDLLFVPTIEEVRDIIRKDNELQIEKHLVDENERDLQELQEGDRPKDG